MPAEQPERRGTVVPAWLVPWLIPLLLVLVVVAAVVNVLLMLVVVLAVLVVVGRWRYLEVRAREARGAHEWDRWRNDAVLRRAFDRYNRRR